MYPYFLLLLSMLPLGMAGQTVDDFRAEIDKIITYDSQTRDDQIPHLMVGILLEGKTYFLDFGSEKDSHPIDSTTLFEIGDISKIFTALLALELELQNQFTLDSSINFYLPNIYQNSSFKNITAKDLLNHHAGFSKYPAGLGAKEVDNTGQFANYQKTDLLQYASAIDLPKNRTFDYSNTGYALLEYLMEQSVSMPYTELLTDYLLQANDLKNTFVNTADFSSAKLLPGYNLGHQPVVRQHYSSFAGSLGLVSSAADLLKLMSINWTTNNLAFKKSLRDCKKIPQEKYLEIGYGWHKIVDKKKNDIYMHTGKREGFRSYLGMVPNTQTAVVVLSNSNLPQNGLGYYILKMINFGWKNKK